MARNLPWHYQYIKNNPNLLSVCRNHFRIINLKFHLLKFLKTANSTAVSTNPNIHGPYSIQDLINKGYSKKNPSPDHQGVYVWGVKVNGMMYPMYLLPLKGPAPAPFFYAQNAGEHYRTIFSN